MEWGQRRLGNINRFAQHAQRAARTTPLQAPPSPLLHVPQLQAADEHRTAAAGRVASLERQVTGVVAATQIARCPAFLTGLGVLGPGLTEHIR